MLATDHPETAAIVALGWTLGVPLFLALLVGVLGLYSDRTWSRMMHVWRPDVVPFEQTLRNPVIKPEPNLEVVTSPEPNRAAARKQKKGAA